MSVVTRFAPSPTGFLHIGSARTALFNWLYARHFGGTFLLRIEDTDRARSTQEAIDAILAGMKWLGLDWDGPVVFQSKNAPRHAEVARLLLQEGTAYPCTCSAQELEDMRARARAAGLPPRYDGRCRDRTQIPDVPYVVRLKAPQEGSTTVQDLVQGDVTVENTQLDDLVLLRSDATPTYMLSVVVDDHDMGVTRIIRGDDHLTNTFRQVQIYKAMGWQMPQVAHIPLIHGADGAKLSKRHGALGVEAYEAMGLLPEALCNYLTRLGWSHGNDEIFSREQAVSWFDVDHIGRSPSRFDMAKLENMNAHYMRESTNENLLTLMTPDLEKILHAPLKDAQKTCLLKGLDGLKQRARTLTDLAQNALFYVHPLPLPFEPKALALLTPQAKTLLGACANDLSRLDDWQAGVLETAVRAFVESQGQTLGAVAQPLRAALTGRGVSPSLFEVMAHLGKDETLARLENVLKQ
jgi:glutamyl-tRNA synthetase